MKRLPQIASLLVALAISPAAWADSPLADAVEQKDRAAVRNLLKQDLEVNTPQIDGMTALHWAAYQDDLDTATLLVNARANVKAKNRYGVTSLSLACVNGNGKMVDLFLKAGADPNTSLEGGEPALMTAARTGRPGPVKTLLAHGAKVNAKGGKSQTALMWAAADGHREVVNLLLKAGADIRAALDSGFTPLFFAVREGRTEVVHALLQAGIDVNEPVNPDKNRKLKKGTTPLTLAVENGHFELATTLLEVGANPNDMRAGYTPLHMLSWVRKPDGGDGADDLAPPSGSGIVSSAQFAKRLVDHGARVNTRLKGGKTHWKGATPFFLASKTADVSLMRVLLKLGADPLIHNAENSTPLMVATGIGQTMEAASAGTETEILEAAQMLLDLGVDIDAVNDNGETAMHGAAYKNLPKVVQFLDDKNAKIAVWNQRNKKGSTPYLIAAGYRPGNFKPSYETMAAIKKVMAAHGEKATAKPVKRVDPYAAKTRKKKIVSKEDSRKRVDLFNGKNLAGWEIQNNGRFSVKNGRLRVDRGTGWLRSVETFADFTLKLQFRFLEANAKSGIFVRTGATSKKDENGWPDNGYQVQCMDAITGKPPLAPMIPHGAPPSEHQSDLAAMKKAYKPVGEWQSYEITAKGETLSVKLNGLLITTATGIKNHDGHLGIQAENGLLEFREIEVFR